MSEATTTLPDTRVTDTGRVIRLGPVVETIGDLVIRPEYRDGGGTSWGIYSTGGDFVDSVNTRAGAAQEAGLMVDWDAFLARVRVAAVNRRLAATTPGIRVGGGTYTARARDAIRATVEGPKPMPPNERLVLLAAAALADEYVAEGTYVGHSIVTVLTLAGMGPTIEGVRALDGLIRAGLMTRDYSGTGLLCLPEAWDLT